MATLSSAGTSISCRPRRKTCLTGTDLTYGTYPRASTPISQGLIHFRPRGWRLQWRVISGKGKQPSGWKFCLAPRRFSSVWVWSIPAGKRCSRWFVLIIMLCCGRSWRWRWNHWRALSGRLQWSGFRGGMLNRWVSYPLWRWCSR